MDRIIFGKRGVVFLFSLLVLAGMGAAQAQKMSPEDIIAKHIDSLGKSDVVTSSKRRIVIGTSEFTSVNGLKTANGHAVFASNGDEMAFFSTFNLRDYPSERIGIFAKKVKIPYVDQGRRSALGSFFNAYERMLDDRIFGGAVFSTWQLMGSETYGGKFETEGKKKIGDRDVWVLKYTPKGGLGQGSYIRLFFDSENFHHLRTEYRQKETEQGLYDAVGKSTGQAPPGGWDAGMTSNGSSLIEDFEDIHDEGGLTVPHKYKIHLMIEGANGSTEFKWNFVFSEYRFVKDFPADFFSFKG